MKDGETEAQVMGCLATSYRIMLADRTVIGPIPVSTIISMIKEGTIKADHPVVNMDTGKAFFPDEDPVIRFLVGMDIPSKSWITNPRVTVASSASSPQPLSRWWSMDIKPAVLILALVALLMLIAGIWLNYDPSRANT